MGMKKGFTLIEIIIVIVIMGVLASLALPKITENVAKGYMPEALSQMGKTLRDIDMCFQLTSAAADCSTPAQIGYSQGVISSTANWSYVMTSTTILATKSTNPAGTIGFRFGTASGVGVSNVTKSSGGAFANFKFR